MKTTNVQEYKSKINNDVFNYLHQDNLNIAITNRIESLIPTNEKEWTNITRSKSLMSDLTNDAQHDMREHNLFDAYDNLKNNLKNYRRHPQATTFSDEEFQNLFGQYLEILCKYLEPSKSSNVREILYESAMLLKSVRHSSNKLGDFDEWIYSRKCEDYMANSNFMCLDCGYGALFYYSQFCPFEATSNDYDLHEAHSKEEQTSLMYESIYLGCILLRMIHKQKNKLKQDKETAVSNIKNDFLNYLNKLQCIGLEFYYIKKWQKGWYYNEKNCGKCPENFCNIDSLINFYIDQYSHYINFRRYIQEIRVENLFGYYSYHYTLDLDSTSKSNLSVIIAPNGLGKTTVLNLLECVIKHPSMRDVLTRSDAISINDIHYRERERLAYLCETPFKNFEIIFSDDSKITVTKCACKKNATGDFESGKITVIVDPGTRAGFDTIRLPKSYSFRHDSNGKLLIGQVGSNDRFSNNNEIIYQVYQDIDLLCPTSDGDNRFKFIRTNRVNDVEWRDAVSFYCMQEQCFNKDDNMQAHINNIDKWIMPSFVAEFEQMFKNKKHLKAFSDSVKLLIQTFNQFFDHSAIYKELAISNEGHLSILIKTPDGKKMGECGIGKLSSGEQNILCILYHVIFSTTKNAILFIDEPEISLHIAWQQQIARVLQGLIKKKNGMQIVITSHSPFIVSGDSNLFVRAILD